MISSTNKIDKMKNSNNKKKQHDDWVEDIASQNERKKQIRNHQLHQKAIELD